MRGGDKRKRYHVERERNSNLVCETTILSRDVTAQSALRCPGCLCGHRDNYLQDILRVSNATDPAASTFAATTDPGAQEFAATHAARTANWALPLCCWEACRIQGPAHAARILHWRWPAHLVHYLGLGAGFLRHCQATRNTNINNPLAVWVDPDFVQWPGAPSDLSAAPSLRRERAASASCLDTLPSSRSSRAMEASAAAAAAAAAAAVAATNAEAAHHCADAPLMPWPLARSARRRPSLSSGSRSSSSANAVSARPLRSSSLVVQQQ